MKAIPKHFLGIFSLLVLSTIAQSDDSPTSMNAHRDSYLSTLRARTSEYILPPSDELLRSLEQISKRDEIEKEQLTLALLSLVEDLVPSIIKEGSDLPHNFAEAIRSYVRDHGNAESDSKLDQQMTQITRGMVELASFTYRTGISNEIAVAFLQRTIFSSQSMTEWNLSLEDRPYLTKLILERAKSNRLIDGESELEDVGAALDLIVEGANKLRDVFRSHASSLTQFSDFSTQRDPIEIAVGEFNNSTSININAERAVSRASLFARAMREMAQRPATLSDYRYFRENTPDNRQNLLTTQSKETANTYILRIIELVKKIDQQQNSLNHCARVLYGFNPSNKTLLIAAQVIESNGQIYESFFDWVVAAQSVLIDAKDTRMNYPVNECDMDRIIRVALYAHEELGLNHKSSFEDALKIMPNALKSETLGRFEE